MHNLRRLFLCSALTIGALGCASDTDPSLSTGDNTAAQSFRIVATTGHIADALRRITEGTEVEIKLLCGPGIDPHSYAASLNDVKAMDDADLIVFNGFHLEAKLHDLLHGQFEKKAFEMASVFPVESRLDWVEDGEVDASAPFDPHIWNHLPGWSKCVEGLISDLSNRNPESADLFRENGEAYVSEIESAHQVAIAAFEKIPAEKRVIVSAHDAFNYFAKSYGFESIAVLGIGNDAEADVRKMREVAQTVCDRKIPVIFIENIANPRVSEALQEACQSRDWSVQIADQPLYSDDLGSEAPVDTYLGAFQSNVDLITQSLQ